MNSIFSSLDIICETIYFKEWLMASDIELLMRSSKRLFGVFISYLLSRIVKYPNIELFNLAKKYFYSCPLKLYNKNYIICKDFDLATVCKVLYLNSMKKNYIVNYYLKIIRFICPILKEAKYNKSDIKFMDDIYLLANMYPSMINIIFGKFKIANKPREFFQNAKFFDISNFISIYNDSYSTFFRSITKHKLNMSITNADMTNIDNFKKCKMLLSNNENSIQFVEKAKSFSIDYIKEFILQINTKAQADFMVEETLSRYHRYILCESLMCKYFISSIIKQKGYSQIGPAVIELVDYYKGFTIPFLMLQFENQDLKEFLFKKFISILSDKIKISSTINTSIIINWLIQIIHHIYDEEFIYSLLSTKKYHKLLYSLNIFHLFYGGI
jgi:hypothetical protein